MTFRNTEAKSTGRWTDEEHALFKSGLARFGKNWKEISQLIPTRTIVQIRTHAQKYFVKLQKKGESLDDNDALSTSNFPKKTPVGAAMTRSKSRSSRYSNYIDPSQRNPSNLSFRGSPYDDSLSSSPPTQTPGLSPIKRRYPQSSPAEPTASYDSTAFTHVSADPQQPQWNLKLAPVSSSSRLDDDTQVSGRSSSQASAGPGVNTPVVEMAVIRTSISASDAQNFHRMNGVGHHGPDAPHALHANIARPRVFAGSKRPRASTASVLSDSLPNFSRFGGSVGMHGNEKPNNVKRARARTHSVCTADFPASHGQVSGAPSLYNIMPATVAMRVDRDTFGMWSQTGSDMNENDRIVPTFKSYSILSAQGAFNSPFKEVSNEFTSNIGSPVHVSEATATSGSGRTIVLPSQSPHLTEPAQFQEDSNDTRSVASDIECDISLDGPRAARHLRTGFEDDLPSTPHGPVRLNSMGNDFTAPAAATMGSHVNSMSLNTRSIDISGSGMPSLPAIHVSIDHSFGMSKYESDTPCVAPTESFGALVSPYPATPSMGLHQL